MCDVGCAFTRESPNAAAPFVFIDAKGGYRRGHGRRQRGREVTSKDLMAVVKDARDENRWKLTVGPGWTAC